MNAYEIECRPSWTTSNTRCSSKSSPRPPRLAAQGRTTMPRSPIRHCVVRPVTPAVHFAQALPIQVFDVLSLFLTIDCQACNLGYIFDGRACILFQTYRQSGDPSGFALDLSTNFLWRPTGPYATAQLNFTTYPLRQGYSYTVCTLIVSCVCVCVYVCVCMCV